jgi:hypothetical protein
MRKISFMVAGMLLVAGAAFAMKSTPVGVTQAAASNVSAFVLMSSAKDLPVAPNPEAF